MGHGSLIKELAGLLRVRLRKKDFSRSIVSFLELGLYHLLMWWEKNEWLKR